MKYFKIFLIVLILVSFVFSDEGMWTFDNPPEKQLKEKYGFEPTAEWLEHVQLSSVRFMDGGSGSFVSSEGLVLTNHHVAVGQLQKMSDRKMDYVTHGFLAKSHNEEIKCADSEINILISMSDITDKILATAEEGMTQQEIYKAKKAKMAEIEMKSKEETGLECEVVNLYHGGEYWLYKYKKYTDVRLVFAPERQAAYFGGDYDNFTFPRYDLDCALFRIYENDKPITCKHFLKWNAEGAKEDELVFVSGHPGSTDRLYSLSQLEYMRDYRYPAILEYINRKLNILAVYAERGQEEQRRALIFQFGLANGLKALTGELEGLQDTAVMNIKKHQEDHLKAKVHNDKEMSVKYGNVWNEIDEITNLKKERFNQTFYRSINSSTLARTALTIIRYGEEIQKDDKDRLDGYHDSELERRKFRLLSPAPIYKDLDEVNLVDLFHTVKKKLGTDDEFVQALIGNKEVEKYANKLIRKTKLDKVEYRKELLDGGTKAIEKSKDPFIILARAVDPILREDIEWEKKNIKSKGNLASEKIAQARFNIYGKDTYPDATFSLRLSYGTVKTYEMNGTIAPCYTTLYGLYDRAYSFKGHPDFELPERFLTHQEKLDLTTPVNFVCTCDIIGGNSGSPVVNSSGDIVGLIFDGNIESLSGRFVYDGSNDRAVSVHTAYMTEVLKKLYDAEFLLKEMAEK